ncbi:glycosyl hydrolase family 28 protein [Pseudoduganella namucuonensis]|uniref:Glycosyl hydrolases family 28 n=1 Tax=Pseudoduganella namucuonensis TaxID=1035707 RepID=A0A1I7M6K8_9BURK|nr:glycosyl hydrolase family 28 protein [Pseudoduganella namucuonensis]SFV17527.1 Glycosyl hydrolases family 28 [Pseudoduganella namucuonensis]
MLKGLFALAVCAAGFMAAPPVALAGTQDRVQVFPFPQAIRYTHHNDDFTVRVRTPGGVWQDLYEYNVKVDLDRPRDASMVYFNFDGAVEVAVQKNNGNFSNVVVRPDSKGVKPVVRNGVAYFTLSKPENLSVEFDGDRRRNLHVFTHAIRKDMPAQPPGLTPDAIGQGKTPDFSAPVVYFGPGIHSGDFRLRSNSTVYIDGSAMLKSQLIIDGVENVKVISDGLFDAAGQMHIRNSKNILIDGPIFFNQPHGTMNCASSRDLEERSIRTIGGGKWSDGLGHFACQRVKISDSFIRTSDDCVTIYNHRWDIWGDSRDISVTDSTLWADIAHAVMIGIHGNTPTPAHPEAEVIERVRFSNIDILEHDEDDPEYEGAIGIMAGDDNLVRDVVFEDIRVERIEEGKLFNLHIAYTPKYNTSPGRGIEDITLRNIAFTGQGSPSASLIRGHDEKRKVRNVRIENVTVGGKRIAGPEQNLLEIGPFVDGVTYK